MEEAVPFSAEIELQRVLQVRLPDDIVEFRQGEGFRESPRMWNLFFNGRPVSYAMTSGSINPEEPYRSQQLRRFSGVALRMIAKIATPEEAERLGEVPAAP